MLCPTESWKKSCSQDKRNPLGSARGQWTLPHPSCWLRPLPFSCKDQVSLSVARPFTLPSTVPSPGPNHAWPELPVPSDSSQRPSPQSPRTFPLAQQGGRRRKLWHQDPQAVSAAPSRVTRSYGNREKICVTDLPAFDGCFHSWSVIIVPLCGRAAGAFGLIRGRAPPASMPWSQDVAFPANASLRNYTAVLTREACGCREGSSPQNHKPLSCSLAARLCSREELRRHRLVRDLDSQ